MKKNFACILAIVSLSSHAATVTNLSGSYKQGQVFLTWENTSYSNAFYKVYRSTFPITSGSQLADCEYLGYTDSHSSQDWNLTKQDSLTRYLRIDSAGVPLSSTTGLFVATTLVNGDYYYAVTVMIDNVEDQTIISESNSLSYSIQETVSEPMPVFQESRLINGDIAEIYSTFLSTKYAVDQPLMNKAGFLAFDFGLYRNQGNGLHPLMIHLHPGGALFLDKITNASENEMIINLEDGLPSGANQGWWGLNENYDVYDDLLNEVPPTAGINYNHTQVRIQRVLDWAFKTLEVDTNRVYIEGTSLGAPGAYFMAITYPERFAAAVVDGGIFDFAFDTDYQTKCSFNAGKKNRTSGNSRLGTIPTNLTANLGLGTYDLLNGGVIIHEHNEKNFPFIIALNGKHDEMMGWTEKSFYYDSVNNNHTGGCYFWDNRSHNGDNGTWNTNLIIDPFRFSKNLSFPAFSYCSLNEDWGNGNGNTGEDHGTLNGSLDWVNEVVDDSSQWQAQIFVRDLVTKDGDAVIYADSATVTITPRRLQHFYPETGDNIEWSVSHNSIVIQSGTMEYQGGLITVPGVKIFKDTITFKLTIASSATIWFVDADGDSFGDPNVFITAQTQPNGYVSNDNDCNDGNAAIHPDALEVCNEADDNCNNQIDEGVQLVFYSDNDNDNFGDPTISINACTSPLGYVADNTDCNDANSDIHPGALEVCNSVDDNCSNQIDEGVQLVFYSDTDNDNFGNLSNSISACTSPLGYVADNTDCNDVNSAIHPGAIEICNEVDDNCNNQMDEGVQLIFYTDNDNDNFGDAGNSINACAAPLGYVADNTDCNDANSSIHPGAIEICNEVDDNCNNQMDEGVQLIFYTDNDNDNFGDAGNSINACTAPLGYVADNTDCNDVNSAIHPGAAEVCNEADDNCNGQIDEGVQLIFFADNDNDNFGNALSSINACSSPLGYVSDNTDCNDMNAEIYPGATDIPDNGIDEDCDGFDAIGTSVSAFSNGQTYFSLYPNPANGLFIVELKLDDQHAEGTVQVINVIGQKIYDRGFATTNGMLHQEIVLEKATPNGMYLVRVIAKDQVHSAQLVYHK